MNQRSLSLLLALCLWCMPLLCALSSCAGEAHTHTYGEPTLVSPTCTVSGHTRSVCTSCGDVVTEALTDAAMQATGHIADEPVCVLSPSCGRAGMYATSCRVCQRLMVIGQLPSLEHIENEGTDSVVPTCVSNGEKVYRCTLCGAVTRTEVWYAHGHTSDLGTVTVEPTATTPGERVFACVNWGCDAVLGTEVIPPLG